jgi:hypothetical protein
MFMLGRGRCGKNAKAVLLKVKQSRASTLTPV